MIGTGLVPRGWRLAAWLAATTAVLVFSAVLFAWSGVYNIAASSGHLALTRAFLELGMRSSVETHSLAIDAPPLDDSDLVLLGAAHYQSGCAPCHGAPGARGSPVVGEMLPPPPPLEGKVADWRDRELFWIVKHGIKYTGMPAWTTELRDDEVWAMVAFLRRLPRLSPASYRALAFGNSGPRSTTTDQLHSSGAPEALLDVCARCHGTASKGPTSALVPRLAGQSERYLILALEDFALGRRPSGFMQAIAAGLREPSRLAVARHYARLDRATPESPTSPSPLTDLGAAIAREGVVGEGIPACLSCHGPRSAPEYPRLDGQSERYLRNQLELFRRGVRSGSQRALAMTTIAKRLNDGQISAASAYFAARKPFRPTSAPGDDALAREASSP